MYPRYFLGFILAIFASISFSNIASAQTATTTPAQTLADFEKYLNQSVESAATSMTADERAFINPTKIREKAVQDNLQVLVQPSSPKAGEQVSVTVTSYLSDLNKGTVSWNLNGKPVLSGIGKRTFTFTNGNAGETTRLTISIITNDGARVSKSLSWTPAGVTLLWEANTYTPPFYKGKPLATNESLVRAVAIPDMLRPGSTSLSPTNMVFLWDQNGEPHSEDSGYGKNSFLFAIPKPYKDLSIGLKVSSLDNTMKSKFTFTPPVSKPFVLFYENHPLLGVWYNRPFGKDFSLKQSELSLSAEPYFFSIPPASGDADPNALQYLWTLNGTEVANATTAITLRNDSNDSGTTNVLFEMRDRNRTSQYAKQSLSIGFSESSTN